MSSTSPSTFDQSARQANLQYLGQDPIALRQTQWFIDPVNGLDNQTGVDAASPLKTVNELTRRFGSGKPLLPGGQTSNPLLRMIVVNVVNNVPTTDTLKLSGLLPSGVLLAFIGQGTTVLSGTLTGVVAQVRSTNTPWQITDAAVASWTPHIGRRGRITSGPNAGQVFWIAADLGANTARVSTPNEPMLPPPPEDGILETVTPGILSIGDPYVIEDLTTLSIEELNVDGAATVTPNAAISFSNFDFQGTSSFQGNVGTGQFICHGCRFRRAAQMGRISINNFYLNCGFDVGINAIRGTAFVYGGLSRGSVFARAASLMLIDYDFMMQGARFQSLGGLVTIGTMSSFGSTVDAINVGAILGIGTVAVGTRGGFVQTATTVSGVSALWGSGAVGTGVAVSPGATFSYQTPASNLTITGASNFRLAGAATGRAWDEAAGAYTTARATTWANVVATIGAGGFSGSAHNVEKNASIVAA